MHAPPSTTLSSYFIYTKLISTKQTQTRSFIYIINRPAPKKKTSASSIIAIVKQLAMLRAMSTRGGPNSYEKLADERGSVYLLQDMEEPQLKRVTTLPPAFFSSKEIQTTFSGKQAAVMVPVPEYYRPPAKVSKAAKSSRKAEKVHPLFGFLDVKRRNKATAKPEFARYIDYLKEGGFGGGGR